jgi:tetratricopeptide (TPR) repeat protein
MMRGDYDDALLTYQRVLVADPDDALARVNLGYICLKKGIFGEAIEHLSKAIRDESDRKAMLYGHYYLGLVYLAREMYGDAEGFLERAIELGPSMSEAHFQLGKARYLAGRVEAAIAAWEKGAAANRYGPWGKRCAKASLLADRGGAPELG